MLRALRACVRGSTVWLGVFALVSLLCIAPSISRASAGAVVLDTISDALDANSGAAFDGRTLVVRLRSFAPRASGRLEVEPTSGGGRVRLTALNLPTPQSLAPRARTYVAWASGGRILRLGELRRGASGRASLIFPHPAEFARYSLIVTAEPDARAEHPTGAPVFSTRANEVAALFPEPAPTRDTRADAATAATSTRRERRANTRRTDAPAPTTGNTTNTTPRDAANAPARNPTAGGTTAAATTLRTGGGARAGSATAAGFFESVDEALKRNAGARTLTLVGDRGARRARGTARVASEDGTAYVRVRFRRVPSPTRFGRGRRYAMWALNPDDFGTTYMGTLPTRNLNRRPHYARTAGVNSDKFRLLVTAERRAAPAPRPRGRRVLMTFKGRRRR
ncbi:MAG TPA: hypothetical protein VGW12_04385 [Pyrinomonadaceae bacterium]|nr:hypothetical protein [Pyrinomonadaceae bacterium]